MKAYIYFVFAMQLSAKRQRYKKVKDGWSFKLPHCSAVEWPKKCLQRLKETEEMESAYGSIFYDKDFNTQAQGAFKMNTFCNT